MTITLPETNSRVADPSLRIETRKLETSEWLFAENMTEASETTDANTTKDVLTTTRREPTSRSTPIRRSAYSVYLDGVRMKMLQQWECIVTEITEDVVCCEMHDLTDENSPVEYAEVFLREFNEFDRPLLTEGAVFYWSIGHSRHTTGTISRTSRLRVRRMPKLSMTQKASISRKVKQLSELIADE